MNKREPITYKDMQQVKDSMDMSNILDWFESNYIESREVCEEILIQYEIDTPSTIEQFYEACVEIRKVDHIISRSLKVYLKFISDLSFVGISGEMAGKKIKEILLGFK